MVPETPEHDQMSDPKCIGPDLYGEIASVKFSGIYSPRSRVPLCTGVLIPNADGSLVLGIKTPVQNDQGIGGKKESKTRI